MSAFWVKKMKRYFKVLDINGGGVLTKKDLENFGEVFSAKENLNPAQHERIRKSLINVWQTYSKLTGPDSQHVTELEFIESIKSQRNDEKFKAILIEYWQSFSDALDTNKDGFLQEDEYRRCLENHGIPNPAKFTKIAFDAIDINHDKKLSKDELTKAFVDFVLSEDERSPYRFLFGPLE